MNAASPSIELRDVWCRRGGVAALAGVSLRIRAGERVALVGPNGAGKSTLLKLLAGFARADAGAVEVLGRRVDGLRGGVLRDLRAEVGQVAQGLALVPPLSALDNALVGALPRLRGWRRLIASPPPAIVAEALRRLDELGLARRAQVRCDRLSGGERQKVAIARLMMQPARLIVADEPTSALDPQAAVDVAQRLVALAAERSAALLSVVHAPGLLPHLADRVVALRAGRIVLDAPLAQLDARHLQRIYAESDR